MDKSTIAIIAIIILSFAIGIYFYPQMPDTMASHWGAAGQVNGYMSKAWGLFLMPVLSVILFLIFLIVPRMDPKWKNIEGFKNYYNRFILIVMTFLIYIYSLTLAWNLGYRFNMIVWLIPAFSILFFYAGVLISHSKMNYSIGIRTPWTLADKTVWAKTHRLGGVLFKMVAITMLAGMIFQGYAFAIMIVQIVAVTIFIIVYSYVLYRRKNNVS